MARSAVTLALYVAVNMCVAVLWHLILFKETLASAVPFAREDPIMPLGMGAMLVHGVMLIWLYPRFHRPDSTVRAGLVFGALAGLFLAAGAIWVEVAKFEFTGGGTYLLLETVYEIASFSCLGLVIALRHKEDG